MKNSWTIAKRDLASFFTTPIGYIFIAGFMLLMGWAFFNNVIQLDRAQSMYQQANFGRPMSIHQGIVMPQFAMMNTILLLMAPFITMGLFSSEKKNQTLVLLMTSPISLWEIVLGKFLCALMFLICVIAPNLLFVGILMMLGQSDYGPLFTNFLGTILMASCYLSAGIFFSAMTENQIVAVSLTFALVLFFWLISWVSQAAEGWPGELTKHLALVTHYEGFNQGMISSTGAIYYLSFIFFGLFLTHKVLDSYRWR